MNPEPLLKRSTRAITVVVVWVAAIAVAPAAGGIVGVPGQHLHGQNVAKAPPAPAVFVTAGPFVRTDFQGDGVSPTAGVRVRFPLGAGLTLEPALSYVGFESEELPDEVGVNARILILDFQLQYTLLDTRVSPYLGLGGGGAVDFRDERETLDFVVSTFSVTAGAAIDLGARWVALTEMRYRTLDEFEDRALSLLIGTGLRF